MPLSPTSPEIRTHVKVSVSCFLKYYYFLRHRLLRWGSKKPVGFLEASQIQMQTTGEKKPGENSEAEITKGVKEMSAVLVCWRSSNWRSWNNSYRNKLHFCCTLFKKRWSIADAATAAGFLRLNEATPSRTGHSVTPLQWYSFILEQNYEGFGFAKRSIVTEVFTEQHTNAFQTLDGWVCAAQFILKVDT